MNWFSNFQKMSNNMNNENCVVMSGSGRTVINGVEYNVSAGASISTRNGKVYINGEKINNKEIVNAADAGNNIIHG